MLGKTMSLSHQYSREFHICEDTKENCGGVGRNTQG